MARRAVIVGGGVIGLCCAHALSRRDYDITIVDAASLGSGASEGNAGWITPSLSGPVPAPGIVGQSIRWMFKSDSPLYVRPTLNPRRIAWLLSLWRNCNANAYRAGLDATARLNQRTFDLFDELQEAGVEFEMHHAGLLFCFLDKKKRDGVLEDLALLAPFGYAPATLEGSDLYGLEPSLARDVQAGIFVQEERQIRPESFVTGLTKRLLDDGADVRASTPVTGFAGSNGRVTGVSTPEGLIEGDQIVIAAGAHSGRIARHLGYRVPIEAGKGYSLHYEPPPVPVSHALYLYERRVGVTPLRGGLRLAGTMEFSGINTRLQRTRVDAIAVAAGRYLSDWPTEVRGRAWAGMRPMTPDGLPVIGRLRPNVTIASGHAMLGVTLAPATGEMVAELIATDRMPEVLRPFDPSRFW